MGFGELFTRRNRKLTWQRLDDEHVISAGGARFDSQEIVRDADYIGLRINELWLVHARKLWRKYYPMLHAFVSHGETHVHDVVGPAQLRTLGERNLEKMQAFNHLVAGPLPHRGYELKAQVGLYAIPGEDSAKALVDVVGKVAAFGGAPAHGAAAALVKQSVDTVLGLKDTCLQIGIENSWGSNEALRSGYYVGMDAGGAVDVKTLWLTPDRRLQQGADPNQAEWFDANDYLVLALERHTTYPSFGAIPSVAQAEAAIEAIMRGTETSEVKRAMLRERFQLLRAALLGAPELTARDASLIAVAIARQLRERLSPGDFLSRSAGEGSQAADLFEAADIERTENAGTASLEDARRALLEVKF